MRNVRTCLKCDSENNEIVIADYKVVTVKNSRDKNAKEIKSKTVAYCCEKHLEELDIEQINDAVKLHKNATDLSVIIYRKRKQRGLS